MSRDGETGIGRAAAEERKAEEARVAAAAALDKVAGLEGTIAQVKIRSSKLKGCAQGRNGGQNESAVAELEAKAAEAAAQLQSQLGANEKEVAALRDQLKEQKARMEGFKLTSRM